MMKINKEMTIEEEAIFYGHMLGDGTLQKRASSYRSRILHGAKQKEYVFWKYNKLKSLCEGTHSPKLRKDKRGNLSYSFYLKSGHYLEKYHQLFYQPYIWKSNNQSQMVTNKIRYKKRISPELIEALPIDPLVLAVWYMDDGSRSSTAWSGQLSTLCFTKEEHWLLQDYLKLFNINTSIVLHNKVKKQYVLYIPAKNNNFTDFVDLIKPIVQEIPSMTYKIKPRND